VTSKAVAATSKAVGVTSKVVLVNQKVIFMVSKAVGPAGKPPDAGKTPKTPKTAPFYLPRTASADGWVVKKRPLQAAKAPIRAGRSASSRAARTASRCR
jgi:hypothetical protein